MSMMLQITTRTVQKAVLVLIGHGKRGETEPDGRYTVSERVARYGANVGASITKAYVAVKMVIFVGFYHSGTANASQYNCESAQMIDWLKLVAATVMHVNFRQTSCFLHLNSGGIMY